jgi:undecaprenyl-diphosphatase
VAHSQSRHPGGAAPDPAPGRTRARAISILSCGAALLFLGIVKILAVGDLLAGPDQSIYRQLQALRTPFGDWAFVAITELGDTPVVVAVTIAVFLWLAQAGAWRSALYWLGTVAGASALNTAVKAWVQRGRPEDLSYAGWSLFSFPSGHCTVNLALYGFLALLMARGAAPGWRRAAVLGAFWTLLIATSRLYLGAHWFSDVLAGLALGSAWLALAGAAYWSGRTEQHLARTLPAVVLATLLAAGSLVVLRQHAADMARYAPERAASIGG